jgi:hypothetical protein
MTPPEHRTIERLLDESPTMLLIAIYIGAQLVLCDADEHAECVATNAPSIMNDAIADFAKKFRAIDPDLLRPLAEAVRVRLHARGLEVGVGVVNPTAPRLH